MSKCVANASTAAAVLADHPGPPTIMSGRAALRARSRALNVLVSRERPHHGSRPRAAGRASPDSTFSGRPSTTGPGRPATAVANARHELRNARGLAHDPHPLGDRREEAFEVDLLESAALLRRGRGEADEEDHRRFVGLRDDHLARSPRPARAWRARCPGGR